MESDLCLLVAAHGQLQQALGGSLPSRQPPAAQQRQQPQAPQQQQQGARHVAPGGGPAAEPSPARPRNTRVLLPQSVEAEVPGWFFERTGTELKEAFKAALRRREQEGVLMTREMRERLAAKNRGPVKDHAVVRVRFPEGISLQARGRGRSGGVHSVGVVGARGRGARGGGPPVACRAMPASLPAQALTALPSPPSHA